ncbi:hypothetical protein KP509_02G076300 [Ceratopteris richardii]|nr:hypothetical protein KP509_02G076300 [Ceratopteris richardii]
MNNAFAATYNDVQSIELYAKISAIVKQSPEALRKFYCLGGYDYHDDMEVPNVKLFDSNSNYKESNTPRDLQFDEKRIMHIMNVNSFEGDLYSTDTQQPATRLTGVWFLPSFINHSCSPNSSRLVVGEAMFIIASRDIAEKEEITISYIDGMFPLKIREEKLAAMGYGFHCQCRRCEAERSVQSELKEYSSQYHELYENAALEVQGAVTSTVHTHIENCPACTELSAVYDGILGKLNSLSSLTNLEKQWILGGYSSAFLAKWLVCGYASGFSPPSDFATPQALQLVEAMKATVPGMLRTLSFATMLATAAQKDKNQVFALVHRLIQLALDECIRVYGKQKFDVVSKLMEQSAEFVPFF